MAYQALPNLAGIPVRYSSAIGNEGSGRRQFEGVVKFRLSHSLGRSYLVPEVLIGVRGSRFFLPSMFGPPILEFNVEPGFHRLQFDFDTGVPRAAELSRINVFVRSQDRVHCFDDGAQLYRCTFEGPRQIARVASGLCTIGGDGDYLLRLFHHTTPGNADAILKSRELWSSRWNLAGTRQLENASYVYFTSLPRIAGEADLRRIAMASDGNIRLQTTSDRHLEKTLNLRVYRGSAQGRTTALVFEVPTALIAPPPLLFHPMVGVQAAYYEVIGPEIVRVGVRPGINLSIEGRRASVLAGGTKGFDYLVLGDASTLEGLAAPYNEEETEQVTHLERLSDEDVFEFWLSHQNQDVVTGRRFEAKALFPNEPI